MVRTRNCNKRKHEDASDPPMKSSNSDPSSSPIREFTYHIERSVPIKHLSKLCFGSARREKKIHIITSFSDKPPKEEKDKRQIASERVSLLCPAKKEKDACYQENSRSPLSFKETYPFPACSLLWSGLNSPESRSFSLASEKSYHEKATVHLCPIRQGLCLQKL